MIFNVIFELVETLLTTVLGILPSLPEMPAGIVTVADTLNQYLVWGVRYVIVYFLGGTFVALILPLIVVLVNFTWIYHSVMWVIKKLPIGAK